MTHAKALSDKDQLSLLSVVDGLTPSFYKQFITAMTTSPVVTASARAAEGSHKASSAATAAHHQPHHNQWELWETEIERQLKQQVLTRDDVQNFSLPSSFSQAAAAKQQALQHHLRDLTEEKVFKAVHSTLAGELAVVSAKAASSSSSMGAKEAKGAKEANLAPLWLFITVPVIDYWENELKCLPLSMVVVLFPGAGTANLVAKPPSMPPTPAEQVLYQYGYLTIWHGKALFSRHTLHALLGAAHKKSSQARNLDKLAQRFQQLHQANLPAQQALAARASLSFTELWALKEYLTEYYGGNCYESGLGLRLHPVNIAKPWGHEIWYTGIEQRGIAGNSGLETAYFAKLAKTEQILAARSPPPPASPANPPSTATKAQHRSLLPLKTSAVVTPLSSLLAGAYFLKRILTLATKQPQRQPILLKVLAPLADKDYGDLYYEMHRKKCEVYIVVRIAAASSGKQEFTEENTLQLAKEGEEGPTSPLPTEGLRGALRLGFNAKQRANYASFAAFKQAFMEAIMVYRKIRLKIDQRLDEKRLKVGVGLHEEVAPQLMRAWMEEVPRSWRAQERKARRRMECFSGLLPLKVGDTVMIPPGVPHSLQHGVRTVEFQTPHYERLIISFNQKTLTQAHWDTEAAFKEFVEEHISTVQEQILAKLALTGGKKTKGAANKVTIADFPAFTVEKVTLAWAPSTKNEPVTAENTENLRANTISPPTVASLKGHVCQHNVTDYMLIYVIHGEVEIVFTAADTVTSSSFSLQAEQASWIFPGAAKISVRNVAIHAESSYLRAMPKSKKSLRNKAK